MPAKPKVMIVDDDRVFAQLLVQRCAGLDLVAETESDGSEAFLAALRNPPDLFVLDVGMPGTDGMTLCELIGANDRLKDIPVIVLTGSSHDDLVQQCQDLGAAYCFKGLEVWQNLKPIIRRSLKLTADVSALPISGAKTGERGDPARSIPKVLLIDDNPHVTMAMSIRLQALGIVAIQSADAEEAEALAHSERPDVIVTDFHMPGMKGDRLMLNLNESAATRDIPVIVITGDKVDGQSNYALKWDFMGRCGAVAYLDKPLEFSELLEELARHITLPNQPAAVAQNG